MRRSKRRTLACSASARTRARRLPPPHGSDELTDRRGIAAAEPLRIPAEQSRAREAAARRAGLALLILGACVQMSCAILMLDVGQELALVGQPLSSSGRSLEQRSCEASTTASPPSARRGASSGPRWQGARTRARTSRSDSGRQFDICAGWHPRAVIRPHAHEAARTRRAAPPARPPSASSRRSL